MFRLKNVLNLGISDSLDIVESNKQRVFNLFIFLGLLTMPIALIINVVRNNNGMLIVNCLQILVLLFAFWITIKRKLLFLRVYLLLLLNTIIFFTAIFYKTGMEYRLLFLIVIAVILFDNNIKFLLFALLITFEFTFCKYLEFKTNGLIGVILIMRIAQVFVPFLITGISLFYLKFLYFKSQHTLQNALSEVSRAKEMNEIFMFSLAHDLRTPFSNISGILKLLKQHKGYTEDELKLLDMIEISTSNSNVLVNQILESNELMKNNFELQPYDLNILVENVVNTARLKAESKYIKIAFDKWVPNCFADVDPMKIDRLISNLINNAIKFSYQSGNIKIMVEKFKDIATISIIDQGIGIAEKNITKIFDPFTKAKRKGTDNEASFGLGLSICKQIAELHGGAIKVISKPGHGSEFVVSLPLSV